MTEIIIAILAIAGAFLFGQRRGQQTEKQKQQERADETTAKIEEAQQVSDGLTDADINDRLRKLARR